MAAPSGGEQRLTASVRGEVQGVGYRYFAVRAANALALRGYARNRADGSVEVVAEGPRPQLERLLAELWRGPGAARVGEVAAAWSAAEGTFGGFGVRH
ncbi:MAG TPA: acylphosphatase [Ktedonobacterales bacterium]|jgi:acylphosphatase